ncbi:MAG TPA: PQQ-dependent sugar dehydrogenase [Fimbriimonadaceae bacterium]|nr:PQQ-dependent sugar dehydrogenase [Fimbriimonadaceae bacterium]
MRWIAAFLALTLLLGCGGSAGSGSGYGFQVVVGGADFPTAIRFAPDGRMFYTEKNTGNIRIVQDGELLPQPFATVPVGTDGEQGLLGLAFDPDYVSNHYVYVFYSEDSVAAQRIARFTDTANVGTGFTVLVDNLPRGTIHNSGRLAFGADGKLYATVGENGDPSNSQTTTNYAGKVLRFNPDGSIPADNPFSNNAIFTLGHRNCFGLAMYPGTGTPYVSENGPTCDDEINRLVPGGNYGWRPGQPCGDSDPNYIQPIRRYSSIIAPTGICFYSGSVFPELQGDMLMTTYVEGALRRLTIEDDPPGHVVGESVLLTGLGGPTDVAVSPDGNIYVATPTAILKVVRS